MKRIRLYVRPTDEKERKKKWYLDADTNKITDIICEEDTDDPIMMLYKGKWYDVYGVTKEKLESECKNLKQ